MFYPRVNTCVLKRVCAVQVAVFLTAFLTPYIAINLPAHEPQGSLTLTNVRQREANSPAPLLMFSLQEPEQILRWVHSKLC